MRIGIDPTVPRPRPGQTPLPRSKTTPKTKPQSPSTPANPNQFFFSTSPPKPKPILDNSLRTDSRLTSALWKDEVKENQKRYEEGQRKIDEAEARRVAANQRNQPVVDALLGDIKSTREKSNAAHSAWVNSTGMEKRNAKQAYDLVNKQFQKSLKDYELHQKTTQSQANKLASTFKTSQAKAENILSAIENATGPRRETLRLQYEANVRAMQSAQSKLQTLQQKSQADAEKLYAAAQEKQKTVQTAFDSWQGTKTKQELKQDWERARYDSNMAAREFDLYQRDPEAYQARLAEKPTSQPPAPQTPQPSQPTQPATNPPSPSQVSPGIRDTGPRNTGPRNIPSGNPGLENPLDQEAWRNGTVPTNRRYPYLDTRTPPTPLISFPDTYSRLPRQTLRSSLQSPLDKLDSITQARDIHGNEIKTANMLTGGGVKLQQNQRAEKKPQSGLQFRMIGGEVRIVGSNQPKDPQSQPAPTSMGQPQPQPMGTSNPKKQPTGMI